jgi:hypothetical protein
MQRTRVTAIAALVVATLAGGVSATDPAAKSLVPRMRFLVLDSRIIETTENATLMSCGKKGSHSESTTAKRSGCSSN